MLPRNRSHMTILKTLPQQKMIDNDCYEALTPETISINGKQTSPSNKNAYIFFLNKNLFDFVYGDLPPYKWICYYYRNDTVLEQEH